VLDQGWSLNYEMFFYLCFSVAMLLPRRLAVPALLVTMVVPAGLSFYYGVVWPVPFALGMLINPMLWEFAAGVVLGWAFIAGLRLPKWLGILLVLLGFALIAATAFEPNWFSPLRPYHWGGPCVLIVAGAAFPRFDLRGAFWRIAAFVGDSSYALYLFHGMIMLLAQHKAPLLMEAIFRYASPWGIVVFLVCTGHRSERRHPCRDRAADDAELASSCRTHIRPAHGAFA
jgi:exopolysaccharide production protein ExoZ